MTRRISSRQPTAARRTFTEAGNVFGIPNVTLNRLVCLNQVRTVI